jgi:hypothetical protein
VLFGAIGFATRWLVFPLAIFLLYRRGLTYAIPWIAVPYGLYILLYLAGFTARLERRSSEAKKSDKLAEIGELLVHAYGTANAKAFSPTRLLEQIKATEGHYMLLKPVAHSVLQRANARDSSLFSV